MARKDEAVKIEEKPVVDPLCSAEYAGVRCRYPWTIGGVSGKSGFCRGHYRLEPGPEYQRVVDASVEWALAKEAA